MVREGRVLVDRFPVRNPRSLVRRDAAIAVVQRTELRGETKLRAALGAFAIDVRGRVALDVGAAAGGFTRALLDAGARRVYAVDVGYGQLLGSLRQDARVVVLERTNLADLDARLVPEPVEIVTVDVSYVALAGAVPQLSAIEFSPRAELIALVKPQFELGLAQPPRDAKTLEHAVGAAIAGIEAAGWRVVADIESPERGSRGAIEFFVHAERRAERRRPG